MVNIYVERTLQEFFNLLKAPLVEPELWWIITPLIVVLFIMTFYFGKYMREQLGWNSALSNSIVLIFVGIDQLRQIYHYSNPPSIWQYSWHPIITLVIILIMMEGIMLTYTAFKHGIPEKLMFFVSSPASVNSQAYVLTTIVYTQSTPTIYTFLAAVVLFVVLLVFLRVVKEIEHIALGYHFKWRKNT